MSYKSGYIEFSNGPRRENSRSRVEDSQHVYCPIESVPYGSSSLRSPPSTQHTTSPHDHGDREYFEAHLPVMPARSLHERQVAAHPPSVPSFTSHHVSPPTPWKLTMYWLDGRDLPSDKILPKGGDDYWETPECDEAIEKAHNAIGILADNLKAAVVLGDRIALLPFRHLLLADSQEVIPPPARPPPSVQLRNIPGPTPTSTPSRQVRKTYAPDSGPPLRYPVHVSSLEPPVLAPTSDFDPTSAYTHCIG
ncbi:uncharacterized protein EI90DRAFT_3137392 [Cantharellus anzutake]|uniref:uncharacterized protein n=1 Tax=Cantharellus anzutake TaxID=1750568 RepID=UPI001902DBC8|nr:uncharacterized protein EI90DRAFT_3137392 [Cantharellus anzutake]KAF8312435.1 hypothetical protein EI90DRAFT_3137392 [Cantharellus anzutake]